MALPMLVGGAECGPSNPLQGLSQKFDRDRGIQQDLFGSGRRGLSKDIFRTQPENVSRDHDFSDFLVSTVPSPLASKLAADAAIYDLTALHASLTAPESWASQQPKPLASWASDFMQQSPLPVNLTTPAPVVNLNVPLEEDKVSRHAPAFTPDNLSWAPNFRMNSLPAYMPQVPQLERPVIDTQNMSWEKEFKAQELHLASEASSSQPVQMEQTNSRSLHDADELAITAGMILDNLKQEENPKFQKSQFMGLMKQFRDRDVVVDGNKIVENDGRSTIVDVKGKSRAFAPVPLPSSRSSSHVAPVFSSDIQREGITELREQQSSTQELRIEEEDPNVAYFQRENEDFVRYWQAKSAISTTRHHLKHTGQSLGPESILQLEAEVQRNMTDSRAWYELGVKQQENEREDKALQALQKAVSLDPAYLSAWLALAVSHANNNDRQGTFEAITSWVSQNTKYKSAVENFNALYPTNPQSTLPQRFSQLKQCLISLATSNTSGEVDADIQIALAILLNTNEEYTKAQDCFRTALAVRPDDWMLYNRVGATMANSGQADQALDYYYRALELNPGYIRARPANIFYRFDESLISNRFNLGISYINLRRYEEAAQHILDALVLQENDGEKEDVGLNRRGVASTVLWDTLKTTSLHLQRPDLAALCDNRDLEGFRNKCM